MNQDPGRVELPSGITLFYTFRREKKIADQWPMSNDAGRAQAKELYPVLGSLDFTLRSGGHLLKAEDESWKELKRLAEEKKQAVGRNIDIYIAVETEVEAT